MPDSSTFSPRQVLGRYELLAPIARGGMGQVWVGRLLGARGFQKLVAIKTLMPALSDSGTREQMLAEEAHLASLIQHPNVVQTMELGEQGSNLYLVMEWVDGESLSYLLKRAAQTEPLPLHIAVQFVAQACRGLHAAHELTGGEGELLGVVHRDISPHNLLVTHSGICKVADFGIAKAMNQDTGSTQTGEIKGKFAYMAPEQLLGESVDRRADLFALGIVLYALTVGKHPFKNPDSPGVVHAITSDEPVVPPSSFLPYYPRALEAVMLKALEKDPERRWRSAEAMRVALQEALPEAFSSDMDAEIRRYLAEVMGDRATARREALRRMLLDADREKADSGQSPALANSGQSAGSLRAISVDSSAHASEPVAARTGDAHKPLPEEIPTLIPPPERKSHALAVALAGVALAALSVLGLRAHHASSEHAAASAPVEAPALSAASAPSEGAANVPPSARAEPVMPSSSAPAMPSSSARAAAASTAPAAANARARSAASAHAAAATQAPAAAHAASKPGKHGKSDDLISPY